VLDVHLPRQSGLDLNRLLEREGPRVPVVFITADHETAISPELRRTGRQCLLKPVDDEALFAAIAAATAPVG
jgi:FixJ family two-component response regulator